MEDDASLIYALCFLPELSIETFDFEPSIKEPETAFNDPFHTLFIESSRLYKMNRFTFNLVVAYSFPSRGIGKDGQMTWKIPADLKRFAAITTPEIPGEMPVIVMGYKTWASLPRKPLPGRLNIVLSIEHTQQPTHDTIFCKFENLIETLNGIKTNINPTISVIGGGEIYKMFLDSELLINCIFATEVYCKKEPEYDTVFPQIKETHRLGVVSPFMKHSDDVYYRYLTYSYKFEKWVNVEETAYLRLMTEIVISPPRDDRTGVGTYSVFGKQLTYDLSDTFPISTTKRMFLRGIFEELMMYIRGHTDNNILISKGIHVWDGNTSRDFLDKRGLSHYKEGDMGSTYGFNFRHFGAEYKGCDADYTGQGFDQVSDLIHLLKTDPSSRRLIINLWNPQANTGAALPACLCMYQFYVRNGQHLDLQIYIRSSDYFLANNWNTCTGALLVHLICKLDGLRHLTPGKLTVCMGDTHIYKSHVVPVLKNLEREPHPFPKLVVKTNREHLTDFVFEDLGLFGYRSFDRISAQIAI
jgi:dihydrofolate reductase/thymidylate synthase